jgi:hypothetical protein
MEINDLHAPTVLSPGKEPQVLIYQEEHEKLIFGSCDFILFD